MTVDDFADAVKFVEALYAETSRITVRVIGHEASSEQATLAQKHRLHYSKAAPDANGGIAQLRHQLRITDEDKPHPFKPWLQGRPHFYVVVTDEEFEHPKTPAGMVNFRAEIAAYRYIDAEPGRRGTPKIVPYGQFNHLMDAQRMVAQCWFAQIAPLSAEERHELTLPESVRLPAIAAAQTPDELERLVHSRQIAELQQLQKKQSRQFGGRRRVRNSVRAYNDWYCRNSG